MIYGSVCSGIESATCAWHPLGWKPAFFSEIDKFPRAVLQHHYPEVPLHGDFRTIQKNSYAPIDLLVGGTPCQDFSVAGLRRGFAGDRGNLTFEFVHLAERLRPRWLVWENVPGCLSIDGGRGFGTFLGMLGKLGYGFAYRTLDAQYFNLAQRRARVFVVAYLGDWRRAAAVLFERESLSGNPPPSREAGQRAAGTLSARTEGGGFPGTDESADGYVVPVSVIPILEAGARTGTSQSDRRAGIGIGEPGDPMFTLQAGKQHAIGFNARQDTGPGAIAGALDLDGTSQAVAFGGNNTQGPIDISTALKPTAARRPRQDFESETFVAQISPTLRAGGNSTGGDRPPGTDVDTVETLIAHALRADGFDASEDGTGRGTPLGPVACQGVALRGRDGGATAELMGDLAGADRASQGGGDKPHVLTHAVRRLTPRECCRLQGFPEYAKTIIVVVCADQQKASVNAEIKNLRSLTSVSPAHVQELLENANHVGWRSRIRLLDRDWPVALNVHTDSAAQEVQIRNAERLLLRASGAEKSVTSPLPIPIADFVQLSAPMLATLVPEIETGKEASHLSGNDSTHRRPGCVYVALSESEIRTAARDADAQNKTAKQATMSITSQVGNTSQNYDLMLQTLSCSVVAAIASYIPSRTQMAGSFAIKISAYTDYLDITHRGKPAADGPKYKALGNSKAVPVVRWIGRRIQMVDDLTRRS